MPLRVDTFLFIMEFIMTLCIGTTRLIHEPSGDYPVYLSELYKRIENSLVIESIDSEALAEFGYFPVVLTQAPIGEVVEEVAPKKIDGVWTQVWVARKYTPDEASVVLSQLKENKLMEISIFQEAQRAIGFPYIVHGELYHVQIRNNDDIGIISTLRNQAKEAIVDEKDTVFKFRFYENVTLELSATEMVALGDTMIEQVQVGNEVIWGLKDSTNAAVIPGELPVMPETIFSS